MAVVAPPPGKVPRVAATLWEALAAKLAEAAAMPEAAMAMAESMLAPFTQGFSSDLYGRDPEMARTACATG